MLFGRNLVSLFRTYGLVHSTCRPTVFAPAINTTKTVKNNFAVYNEYKIKILHGLRIMHYYIYLNLPSNKSLSSLLAFRLSR